MTARHPATGAIPVLDDPGLPRVAPLVDRLEPVAVGLRRDLHAHPELSYDEHRTTARILEVLSDAGLSPVKLEETGAYVDIGEGPLVLGLRAVEKMVSGSAFCGLPSARVSPFPRPSLSTT